MRAYLTMTILAGIALFAVPAQAETDALGGAPVDEQPPLSPPIGTSPPPSFFAHPTLEHVAEELSALWRNRPDLFEAVEEVREAVAAYHRGGAWRPMNVARLLDQIGDERLLPLLWALESDDPFVLQMGLKAWIAWRVGLIESVGRLGDARSVPVLLSIVSGEEPQAAIRRAAVASIGRTGDVDGIAATIAVAEESVERRAAVIEGLGQARRAVAADYLLRVSKDSADPRLRRAAVRSLGDWGNLEAWRTPALSLWRAEGEAGRKAIVESLVDTYPEADHVLRAEIAKTLQLVDVLSSASRAAERAETTEEDAERSAWRELEEAMMRSPLRARQERFR